MTGYVIDPLQPLPLRWKDKNGPIRLITKTPVEGYVMVRRPGAFPFVLALSHLLDGHWEPILPKPKINVREKVAEWRAKQSDQLAKVAHGGPND